MRKPCFLGCKFNFVAKTQYELNLIILSKAIPRAVYEVKRSVTFKMSEQNSNKSPKENNTENVKPKLKVLAFHGYRQNGAVFRAKIGSFRKAVNKYAQLTFISAPHKVANDEGGGDEGTKFCIISNKTNSQIYLIV